jgi:fatty-acyl-CoA synthase
MTPLEERDPARRRDTHGAPLPGVSVRIVDPETGETLPRGQAGEITFKGWNRFEGYYGDPERTAATIDARGFCYTGDRGVMGEDGYLRFLGRYKEMVKTGGENVSQLEVERFLEGHIPGVATAFVIGVPDPIWDEAVTAVIELEPGTDLDPEAVRAGCRGRLASFKIPKHVLFVSPGSWPTVGSNKIDKRSLRGWAMQELGISADEKET